MEYQDIITILGADADQLLGHVCEKIPKESIHLPHPDHVADIFGSSDRSGAVLGSLKKLYNHGTLGHTGYLSIFPVDQAIEHTAAYSFYKNPEFFDPETIIRFAVDGGCSGVASTYGVLSMLARKYADKIPLILKINHNELLTIPAQKDQSIFSSVKQAADMGATAVGATIYFGSPLSREDITTISEAFAQAHELGLATILWCYPRNDAYISRESGRDYSDAVDISSQAIHLGVTIGADIVKQKLPTAFSGFSDLSFAKWDADIWDTLLTNNPIDLVRYQVLHAYAGRVSLINSGGESSGDWKRDLADAVKIAVINKRGGGAGLIMGRKLFNHSYKRGLEILSAVQAVYGCEEITVA